MISEKEVKNIKEIFCQEQEELLYALSSMAVQTFGGDNVVSTDDYMYARGEIPVLLVAHLDTVHPRVPEKFFFDWEQGVVWSPDGLGADDRAGVYAILEILEHGFRPHVLFTTEEEIGSVGAEIASREILPEVDYIVELDRKGADDAVFYECENEEFKSYVLGFGFMEARGTASDIRELCPAWDVAGVNLSIGYHRAHSTEEYLAFGEMQGTIERLKNMLSVHLPGHFGYGTS